MKKWVYLVSLGTIFILSFRFFSSAFYPLFNSDNAVPVLMIHYFKLPRDVYYWGIDRLGSLIPLLAQAIFVPTEISALMAESITHFLILLAGYLAFASFIKSYFYRIVFAVIWFFPPMHLIDLTQFYLGIHYSLIGIVCFLFNLRTSGNTRKAMVLTHLRYLIICLLLIVAVWVSDMAAISAAILIGVQIVFYIRKEGFSRSILRESFLYYILTSAIVGYFFIHYAKGLAPIQNQYSRLCDLATIIENFQLFLKTLLDFFLFRAHEPFTSIYSYLVIILTAFILSVFHRIKMNPSTRKIMLVFFLDAIILFSIIMVSYWTTHNFVPRRYFVCTYVSLSVVLVILLDNLPLPRLSHTLLRMGVFITVLIGGLGTLYNLKFIYPKRLTPMTEITREFSMLGEGQKIGTISEYWNSYIVSCTQPDRIISTPHDKAEVKNFEFVEELFTLNKIYVNRDMWMASFPDTLHQFNRTLVREGYPFRIAGSNVCEYKVIR